jgi:hypothetical protein
MDGWQTPRNTDCGKHIHITKNSTQNSSPTLYPQILSADKTHVPGQRRNRGAARRSATSAHRARTPTSVRATVIRSGNSSRRRHDAEPSLNNDEPSRGGATVLCDVGRVAKRRGAC